ncbi:chloroplastic import inner membrane translocase subunit HP30-2-like [Papaver somniferum]|uniref:chloroplastic import inner membrane translocase subunit HP30-2-like n=1 Tax=Papaver somniferum TaxID=3469 RepID=UPI000E7059B8|nr:chloroplastic import inner membrane translocase subunit HP30-2-like [Papaver somniferum]
MEDKHKWFYGWVCNLSFPIQFIFATASGAVQGGGIGASGAVQGGGIGAPYGTLAKLKVVHNLIPSKVFVSACIQARDFSALMATDGAMSCVGKRITGKYDIQARMMTTFVAGFMFQLFRKRSGADAIIYGAIFAAWHGILHKEGPLIKVLFEAPESLVCKDSSMFATTKIRSEFVRELLG